MDGTIKLRGAIRADAAALGKVHVVSWRETYVGILPDTMLAGMSVEPRTAMWSDILGDPAAFGDAAVFVAEDDARVVGFGSCGRQRDAAIAAAGFGGEIGAVYVLRSHQGRGVGGALMAALARSLSDRGHGGASLWVLRENAAARRFYERLDAEVVGERSDEQPGVTLVEVAYGWHDLSRLLP